MIIKLWLNLNRSTIEHDPQKVAELEQQRGAFIGK
jgi:hypothetical protein